MTTRQWMESDDYIQLRGSLLNEINAQGMKVDYSVFEKSKEEKEKTLNMKWANLEERQRHYGKDANKHLNIPSRQLSEPIHLTF